MSHCFKWPFNKKGEIADFLKITHFSHLTKKNRCVLSTIALQNVQSISPLLLRTYSYANIDVLKLKQMHYLNFLCLF